MLRDNNTQAIGDDGYLGIGTLHLKGELERLLDSVDRRHVHILEHLVVAQVGDHDHRVMRQDAGKDLARPLVGQSLVLGTIDAGALKLRRVVVGDVVIEALAAVTVGTTGDIHKAHEAGCEFVKSLAGVEPVECDIAITTNGGYPLDQNIYQAVKGMCAAEATLPEGGVIIDVAGCADGHGGEGFYHNIADNDPAEFERACIDRPKDETLPDQWTSQIFARILAHHPVIMVTDLCDHQMIKDMHMTPVNTLEEALKLAFEMKGADAKVAVIPDGLGVVVAQH